MTIKIVIKGKLTSGYYNSMEAEFPVFIDDEPVDDKIKEALSELGLNDNFCYGDPDHPEPEDVKNELIGRKVKLTLEIDEGE